MNSIQFDITDDLPDLGSFVLPQEAVILIDALREEIEAVFGHGKNHKSGSIRAGLHRTAS